jgi:hypothetical protein
MKLTALTIGLFFALASCGPSAQEQVARAKIEHAKNVCNELIAQQEAQLKQSLIESEKFIGPMSPEKKECLLNPAPGSTCAINAQKFHDQAIQRCIIEQEAK